MGSKVGDEFGRPQLQATQVAANLAKATSPCKHRVRLPRNVFKAVQKSMSIPEELMKPLTQDPAVWANLASENVKKTTMNSLLCLHGCGMWPRMSLALPLGIFFHIYSCVLPPISFFRSFGCLLQCNTTIVVVYSRLCLDFPVSPT